MQKRAIVRPRDFRGAHLVSVAQIARLLSRTITEYVLRYA